ncbi:MAG: D-2-hydroxyacid dehydrogenase [Bacteroidota bacterium]
MKILANDGLSAEGISALEKAGFEVQTTFVPQDQLIDYVNNNHIEVLLVRSATKVRKDLFDACANLKFVGRGGVGMDNIDVEYGRSKGVKVMNTPGASSISVAELVIAHCFTLARFLHQANRKMPVEGVANFKNLKKKYEAGSELRGKTIGIVGMGRIGQQTARYALGCGMKVIFFDRSKAEITVTLDIFGAGEVPVTLKGYALEEVVKQSDFISLHVPAQADGKAVIDAEMLKNVKPTAYIINTARGGSVDEAALAEAIKNGKIAGAALDVFNNEPTPDDALLQIEEISLTPHIGAATAEAQDRIGLEMADIIIEAMSVKA